MINRISDSSFTYPNNCCDMILGYLQIPKPQYIEGVIHNLNKRTKVQEMMIYNYKKHVLIEFWKMNNK